MLMFYADDDGGRRSLLEQNSNETNAWHLRSMKADFDAKKM
jgi:hypothetical protein